MRIGRLELSPGFLLLVAWLNYMDEQEILPSVLLACLMHEMGHLGAIWWFKGRIQRMRLSVVGAEIQMDGAQGYVPEGIIALAGPGVNLAAALVLSQLGLFPVFVGINLVLGCFNLMPLCDLDGGKAMSCALALVVGANATERVVSFFRYIGIVTFGTVSVYLSRESGNYTLVLIALWLIGREIGKKDGFRSCQREWKQVK